MSLLEGNFIAFEGAQGFGSLANYVEVGNLLFLVVSYLSLLYMIVSSLVVVFMLENQYFKLGVTLLRCSIGFFQC